MNIPMVGEMFAVLKLSCKQIRNEIENVSEVPLSQSDCDMGIERMSFDFRGKRYITLIPDNHVLGHGENQDKEIARKALLRSEDFTRASKAKKSTSF